MINSRVSRTHDEGLLRAKLYRPRVPADLVHRSRLNKRLTEALDGSWILVTAPAGFGKSVLLSSWLETCDLPHAWISLDENDNDVRVFLGYLVAAVRTIDAGALSQTLQIVNSASLPSADALARNLVSELDEIGSEFVLVLDDFHAIRDQTIHGLLSRMLEHPPQTMHLAIATRLEPPLPLSNQRAKGMLVDIQGSDLRFSEPEIATFVEHALGTPLTGSALSVLVERTEGWAACVRLALLTLRFADDVNRQLVELHVENRYVIDYLMSEVMAQIPPAVRTFLLRTSILDEISPQLAQAVTTNDDPECNARECLAWLKRAGMFTESLDVHGEWYRYHHLFQLLLGKERAQTLTLEDVQDLHRRASAWYASQKNPERALRHALAAQDTQRAIQYVAQYRHHLLNTEQRARLGRWLRLFSSAEMEKHPDLLLACAWCARLNRESPARVAELTDRAEAAIGGMIDDPVYAGHLRGEVDILRCVEKGFAGNDPPGVINLASRGLELVPREWYLARATAFLHLAAAYQMSGRIDEAYATAAAGRREQMAELDHQRVRSYAADGFVAWMAADLAKVMQTGRNIMSVRHETDLPETTGWGHCFQAMVYYQRNELSNAERSAKVVQERRPARDPMAITQSAFVLASIHQARSSYEEARLVLDTLNQYLREAHKDALLPLARAFGAELAARQGNLDASGRWAATVGPTTPFGIMAFFYAPQLTLPKVLLAMNTPTSRQQAALALRRVHAYVTSTHNTRFTIEALALQAWYHHAEGNEPAALQALEQALTLAQPGGLLRVFLDIGSAFAPLLARLQSHSSAGILVGQILETLHADGMRPQPIRETGQSALIESLTPREFDVLELLVDRLSDKEIAEKLYISPRTVNRHAANLYQKLGVGNRREAVAAARSLGLL